LLTSSGSTHLACRLLTGWYSFFSHCLSTGSARCICDGLNSFGGLQGVGRVVCFVGYFGYISCSFYAFCSYLDGRYCR
jgi:hypothetical protein